MAASFEQILADALSLPLGQREVLADHLWGSIETDDDAPLSPEWEAEIKRRIQDIDNGAKGIPMKMVIGELRAELRLRGEQT